MMDQTSQAGPENESAAPDEGGTTRIVLEQNSLSIQEN
jgi:hypothetical protein